SRYRASSGSFQNPTGIDGIGAVSTSSPTSPVTGLPAGSNASTLAPRQRPEITPARTGSNGDGPTNPVHRSVPPENEPSSRSCLTSRYTQSKPSGGSGEPVDPMARSAARSSSVPGCSPAFMLASRYGAPSPR